MRSVDLVISAYKEDLEWLNHIPATFHHVYIYNKGPGMISGVDIPYTEIKLKNIGRCDHTYLYHVIHNYNNLADVTIFATGSTYALTHKRNKFRFTLNKTLETRNTVFYADRYENVKKDLYNFTMESYPASYANNNIGVNSTKMIQANIRPFGKWYDEHFPNLDIHAVTFSGVFSVSKEHIHQHPTDYYINLMGEFPFHPNPEVGHYFERSWIAIFDPIPEECLFYTNNISFQLSKVYKNTCQNFYFIYFTIVILLSLCIWYILKSYGRMLKIRPNKFKLFMYISIGILVLALLHYNPFYKEKQYNNLNVGVVITTCKHYFTNVYTLIKELKSSGFDAKDIIIISGQEDENEEVYIDGVFVAKVKYTGLNLTGLIYMNEHMHLYKDKDYWINLPCTISVGKSFGSIILNRLRKIGPNELVPFINPAVKPTMDIGIIPTRHIIEIEGYLKKMKLDTYTEDDIHNLKRQLIFDEDMLFCLPLPENRKDTATPVNFTKICKKPRHFFVNNKNEIQEYIIKKDDKEIMVTYFKALDFKKYQRNFKGTQNINKFVLEL
jgi:hypothetical protein